MKAIDPPREPRQQIVFVSWWLIGTLACLFLVSCTLDFGVVLALPVIGLLSSICWLVLLVRGLRAGWAERARPASACIAAAVIVVALPILMLFFTPLVRVGSYVQVQAILAFHISEYRREVEQLEHDHSIGRPTLWSYGGWLSIDRDIVFYHDGNPSRHLMTMFKGSSADCRWLRDEFYDCTIDY